MSETITALLANNVEDVLAQLDDFSLEDLQLALETEKTGKDRKGVLDGLNEKIEVLTKLAFESNLGGDSDGAGSESQSDKDEPDETKPSQGQKKPDGKNVTLKNPVDGAGRSLKRKPAVKKTKGKKGAVDGLGRPL